MISGPKQQRTIFGIIISMITEDNVKHTFEVDRHNICVYGYGCEPHL